MASNEDLERISKHVAEIEKMILKYEQSGQVDRSETILKIFDAGFENQMVWEATVTVLSDLVCRHCVCDDAHIVEVLRVQRNTLMEECLRKNEEKIDCCS